MTSVNGGPHPGKVTLAWVSKADKVGATSQANPVAEPSPEPETVPLKTSSQPETPRADGENGESDAEVTEGCDMKPLDFAEEMVQKFLAILTVCNIHLDRIIPNADEGKGRAGGSKELDSAESFRQQVRKEEAWNYEEWEGTANLAEAAGETMERIVQEEGLDAEGLPRVMLHLVLDLLGNGRNESAWMDMGAIVDSVVDRGTENFDEEEMGQIGAQFLELAMEEGSRSRARHEMVAVLQAMAFLREPLEKLQSHDTYRELAVDVAEVFAKAGLFIGAMCHAPSPHRMLRSSANQHSLAAYEGELKLLARLTYTKCFPILVAERTPSTGPIFVVPYPRNPMFAGCEPVLEKLSQGLHGQGSLGAVRSSGPHVSKVRVLTLTGPCGIGKTEIAIEFAYRHAGEYDGVLWVDAHPAVLEYNFVALKSWLGIQVVESDVITNKVDEVRLALEDGRKFLLILDNLESAEMGDAPLDRLLPKAGSTHVLITAASSVHTFRQVVVQPLDEEEAWELLTMNTTVPSEDSTTVEEIGQLVFFHPLGLKAVGSILRNGHSAESLLLQLRKAGPRNPLEGPPSPEGMFKEPSRLRVVLEVWLEGLQPAQDFEAKLASAMVDVAGWFGPQAIPLPLLAYAAHILLGRESAMDRKDTVSAAARLVRSGMVQPSGQSDGLQFPPMLQAFVRSRPRARLASKAALCALLRARCFEATALHFAAVWSRRQLYDARRDTMGLVWPIAAGLARYWARTNQTRAALALCDEVLELGPRGGEARCEFLFWRAYLLGGGRGARKEQVQQAAAELDLDEVKARLEHQDDALTLLVKVHKLHFAILLGSRRLDDLKEELADLWTNLATRAERIPPRDVAGPLGDFALVSEEGTFVAYGLSDLSRLVVVGGLSFSYGGDKWLDSALAMQQKGLLLMNRAFPLMHASDLATYSSAASLYFRLYGIAVAQQHFHDCFRPILSPKAPPSGAPAVTPPKGSQNPLHRAAFSDKPPPDLFDSDSDEEESSSSSDEEEIAEAASTSGRDARGFVGVERVRLGGGVEAMGAARSKVEGKSQGMLDGASLKGGRGLPSNAPGGGEVGDLIAEKARGLERKWGYGCRPQWLTAVCTFGSVHFTPERQREACQVFTAEIQLARAAGDSLLEAQGFTHWALAEPNSPDTPAFLEHCRGLLLRQLKLLPSNPRLCVQEKHTLRILLAHVYLELAGQTAERAATGSGNGGAGRVASSGGAAEGTGAEREWRGLPDEGKGMSDPSLDAAQRAVQFLRNCVSIAERSTPDYIPLYSLMLALCLIQLGQYGEAQAGFKKCLALLESRQKWVTPVKLAQVLGHLASAYWLTKQPDVAKGYLERAKALLEREKGDTQLLMADILDALGRVYALQGQLEMAWEVLGQSRKIRLQALGPKHPALVFTLADMASVQEDMGNAEEATKLRFSALAEVGANTEPDLTALRAGLQANMGAQAGAVQQFFVDKRPNMRGVA